MRGMKRKAAQKERGKAPLEKGDVEPSLDSLASASSSTLTTLVLVIGVFGFWGEASFHLEKGGRFFSTKLPNPVARAFVFCLKSFSLIS